MITLIKTQSKVNVWRDGNIIAQFTTSAKVKPYSDNSVLIQDEVDKFIFDYDDLDKANSNPVVTASNPTAFVLESIVSFFPNAFAGGGTGGGGGTWGSILGTLSNQTDLQTALNLKANLSLIIQNESVTSVTDIDFTENNFYYNDNGTATAEIFTFTFANSPKVGATFIALKNNTALNPIPVSGIQEQIGEWKANTDQTFIFTYLGNSEVFLNIIDQIDLDAILGLAPQGNSGTVQTRLENSGGRAYIPIPFISNNYYDQTFGAGGQGTTTVLTVGTIFLAPFYFDGVNDLNFDNIGLVINNAGASGTGNARVLVYDADGNNRASQKIYELEVTGLNSGSGIKEGTLSGVMERGKWYWVGGHFDSNATIRTVAAQNSISLGRQSSAGTGYFKGVQRTLAYASGSPTTWVWDDAELSTNNAPIVSFQAV